MHAFLLYILLASGCISLAYLFYKILLEKKTAIKTIRLYLLMAMLVSLLVPLLPVPAVQAFVHTPADAGAAGTAVNVQATRAAADHKAIAQANTAGMEKDTIIAIVFYLYLFITLIFLIRIARELYALLACYRSGEKEKRGRLLIVWNRRYSISFSFFHLVFLNKEHLHSGELHKVLVHEKVHALQYHSADRLLMQLLTAFMWFNPVIWAMRNAVQLVHEYLADDGVLNAGINKVQYQQLLLQYVTESKLISLSSALNHSLLKKRFIMMSATKAAPATKFRLLLLLPVTALMLLGVACVNGQATKETPKVITAVALTRANMLYIGVENPVNISVSGYSANEITVSIDNGSIEGRNGEYVIKPKTPGKAVVIVSAEGKVVKENEFRVSYLPQPVVALAHAPGSMLVKGGDITKDALLKAGGIIATVENSDVDIPIKVSSFTISVINSGNMQVTSASSNQDKYSADQVKLVQSLAEGQRLIVDEITASGPDGRARKMPSSMVFTIKNQ
jgi:beta-lactamase regulating signal transducer with metallopeptidase domain